MRRNTRRARMNGPRLTLGLLLAFGALNAFGGGWYGLSGAPEVPHAWLEGTPFRSYFIPSLVLIVGVGGAFAFGAFAVLTRQRYARRAALAAGAIVLGWIVVQVALIGYVSWLQPVTFVCGVLILVLGSSQNPAPGER